MNTACCSFKFLCGKNIPKRKKIKANFVILSLLKINIQVDDYKMREMEVTGKEHPEDVVLVEF